jgi:hypothetical protein
MPSLIRPWYVLAATVALAACSSGHGEAMKPVPQSASVKPEPPDAGAPGCASCGPQELCVEGRCVCQPLTCLSGGGRCGKVSDGCGGVIDCGPCSRCGPQEMDCCGTCIPRSEKRCPENVHCPTAPPEM